MKTPYDDLKTKEIDTSDLKDKDTLSDKLQSQTKLKCKTRALIVFMLILFIVATYEYFTLGKRLNNTSITFLVVMVFSLAMIIKKIRKIEEYKEDSFFIKTFRAKMLLSKVKRLVQWLNSITLWQRHMIFFAIFVIGYLIMII